jgi:diaminohydroxyphosphoribosylaminopyrimidine deaminase/5-amino-6-(5-phosphoribosylamino)uracil reductase
VVQSAAQDVWIFCSVDAPTERSSALEAAGARISRVAGGSNGLDIAQILTFLHQEKFLSVLLEAGSRLNGSFLRANLVDRVVLYFAEVELGAHAIPFATGGPSPFVLQQQLSRVETQTIGADIRVSGLLHDPWVEA